jgi:hypothetical protein
MKRAIAAFILATACAGFVSGQPAIAPASEVSGITFAARAKALEYLNQNKRKKESPAPEMFLLMSFCSRGETAPEDLYNRVLALANSGNDGGWFDSDTLKLYGSLYAVDFCHAEHNRRIVAESETKRDAEQDEQILKLQTEIRDLKIQLSLMPQPKTQ